jgi:predicted small metal-binding protein
MAMILHCSDAGFDCDAVVQGETADDILAQVRPHASAAHHVSVTPAMEDQLRSLIRRS